jgi:hypothetical protein
MSVELRPPTDDTIANAVSSRREAEEHLTQTRPDEAR